MEQKRQPSSSRMEQKRQVPTSLATVLKWDAKITNQVVKFVDTKFGPLVKYRGVFKGLEISCHGIPWLTGTATFIFLISNNVFRHLLVNLFLALLVDIAVVAVVKASTRRRRPAGNANDEMFGTYAMDKFSFPSGHSTRAVMITYLLLLKYNLFFPFSFLLLLWSSGICASRVLLKRHHILDVVGGIAIGWMESIFIANFTWLSTESCQGLVGYFLDESRVGASYDV